MTLMTIDDPHRAPPTDLALFALGFRPFYLLAALFAAIAVPAWVLMLAGRLPLPLPGYVWHAHEMILGFASAAIIGFLYTAGRNWTGIATPSGGTLAALALLWLAGRLGMALAPTSVWVAAIDMSFVPLAAYGFGRVLVLAKNRRNYFLVGMLGLLALANLGFHLAVRGVGIDNPLQPLIAALGVLVAFVTVIGGRVVPMFTANAVRNVRQWQRVWLDRAAIGTTLLALLWWPWWPGHVGAALALAAATLQAVRSAGWNPWASRHNPILWVLHAAHLWVPVGLLLVALAQWGIVAESAAVHALAIGAVAGVVIGMMTRTARGHTARPVRAERTEVIAYVALQGAVFARVLTLIALPAWYTGGLHLATTLWALAFGAYFVRYLPWLLRARPDGRPG